LPQASDLFRDRPFNLPETPDDFLAEISTPYRLPPVSRLAGISPSLELKMTPVKNQAQVPACASFAVTALLEFKHKKYSLAECNLIIRCKDQTSGGQMQYAKEPGLCESRFWPFKPDQTLPCATLVSNIGSKFYFDNIMSVYTRVPSNAAVQLDVESGTIGPRAKLLRAFLAEHRVPVAIEVPVLWTAEGWPKWGWDNDDGNVRIGNAAEIKKALAFADKKGRWHSVPICGYDDSNQRFSFKNSWGTDFAKGGYGTVSYAFVEFLSRLSIAGL
jgi:hypothetical protein